MAELVRTASGEGVAEIVIDSPPVNAIGAALRKALYEAVEAADADPAVRVIVLRAAGRTWPAGADIREFGKPLERPILPELNTRIAGCGKPVIAALHGTVLGGGLELALATTCRVAAKSTRLGFPEVGLGVLPGAGGTQRAPRLIGAEAALAMMLSGKPVTAAEAERIGLVDAAVEGDAGEAALALAADYLVRGDEALPARAPDAGFADSAAYFAAIAAARKEAEASPLPAPARIVDCVEAAMLLPPEAGMAFERAGFEDLVASPEAAGLRHAFFAERLAPRFPEAGLTPRPVDRVGIVGGGLMGSGIAQVMLSAGLAVTLVERNGDQLARALGRIASAHERAVARGRMTEAQRAAEWARVDGATEIAALGDCDLAIEAVFEDEAVKRQVMADMAGVLRPGAILATNTSYLDVNALAEATGRPADVLGLHFFSPAPVMRLVEIVVGRATAPEVVATGLALARRAGKVPVRAGVCDGFIGNRILTAYRSAADFLLEDGATPYQVDRAMRAYGFALGPYQVLDLAGLEISWARRKRLAAGRDPAQRYVAIGDRLCEAGWIGQKSGRGYYLYPDGSRQGAEDPEVLALIAAEREAKGIVAQPVSDDEIRDRCLAAMANEGARLLAEGIAQRPSDIDAAMLFGFGFPRHRGGPMHAADILGPVLMRKRLMDYAALNDAWFWRPAPLWDELIRTGTRFSDLDG
ncbi:MAG: 3-hydroxyacyl-CoA dehydrogenase NAD-binding domain-containing protein [Rhodobacteraceae bacterium]|nr:3-hydroxyacyl-CoA dehydrogenase NAD-binding domain-containing protein [Paracoccaceae bacterium]